MLGTRLGAGLKITRPALMHVVPPNYRLCLCVRKRDAGRLRPLDANAVGEEAPGDLASSGFGLLFHWRRGKNVIGRFRGLHYLRGHILFRECTRQIRLESILWSDVDFWIGNLCVRNRSEHRHRDNTQQCRKDKSLHGHLLWGQNEHIVIQTLARVMTLDVKIWKWPNRRRGELCNPPVTCFQIKRLVKLARLGYQHATGCVHFIVFCHHWEKFGK